MIGYSKAKLLGRVFRYEADFADSGGSIGGGGGGWGGGDGGGWGGGQDAAFGGVADSSIAPGAGLSMGPPTESQAQAQAQAFADSLSRYEAAPDAPADAVIVSPQPTRTTGTPIAQSITRFFEAVVSAITPTTAPNLSMGPPTESQAQAQAQAFANSLARYEVSPADAVIVPPAKSAPPLTELLPLEKVEVSPDPVATVTLDRVTSVDIGQLFNNVTTALLGALGIASGTPAGAIGGARGLAGLANAPSAFSERMVESVSFGSPAPSIFAGSEAPAAGATFAGADTGGMAGDGVQASPVLGFGGVVIGAPQTTTTSGGSLAGLPAGLASLFAPPGNTRQLYGTVAQQQPAAPAINPALALAGLAGLIFLG